MSLEKKIPFAFCFQLFSIVLAVFAYRSVTALDDALNRNSILMKFYRN